MELKKGLIQVYTGNGKGKTTAALGQGLRCAGNGLKVYMVQFLKSNNSGELESVKKLYPEFQIFRFERPRGFFWTLNDKEKEELKEDIDKALKFCSRVVKNIECDVLILDEVVGALNNGLVPLNELLNLIKNKPDKMEIILTGRDVPQEIIDRADLVTEMREIKHYFKAGVPARKGIEF